MGKKTVGVAIITRNRPDVLRVTINAHLQNTLADEIIIIDDWSDIPVKSDNFTVYRPDEWLGVAGARNYALSILDNHDYVILCDDDVIPKNEWWVEEFINVSDAAIVPILLCAPNRWGEVIKEHGPYIILNRPTATIFFMTKKAREILGGFEVASKYGCEDGDYYERARRAGLFPPEGYPTIRDVEFYLHVCDIYGDYPGLTWQSKSSLGDAKWEMIRMADEKIKQLNESGTNPIFKPFRKD